MVKVVLVHPLLFCYSDSDSDSGRQGKIHLQKSFSDDKRSDSDSDPNGNEIGKGTIKGSSQSSTFYIK